MKREWFMGALLAVLVGASSTMWGQADNILYVPGSSQKVCQVTGETDREFDTPTASRTETRYGLFGADLGYSFEHDGRLFFLFGDAMPTKTFNNAPNGVPPRSPLDDDAIGFVWNANLTNTCPALDFIAGPNGAYQSPVVRNAQGQPAITLRIDEFPDAGTSQGGRMYVIFATDNYVYLQGGAPLPGNLGFPTRTVVGVSADDAQSFHFLYDFSKPAMPGADGAKFIYVAIAHGDDGYIYFWGSEGGTKFRHSVPYLARKKDFLMDVSAGMEYFTGLDEDGEPQFSPSESDAIPLFTDTDGPHFTPTPCTAQKGVEWNPYIRRWVMIYDCTDQTPLNLPGIYMRTAQRPWGPWSAPQTIFNAGRDWGTCYFIHRAVDAQNPVACDDLSTAGRIGLSGGNYAPYFISPLTLGDKESATSTFYWTMATFNPYTQMIMKTTVRGHLFEDDGK